MSGIGEISGGRPRLTGAPRPGARSASRPPAAAPRSTEPAEPAAASVSQPVIRRLEPIPYKTSRSRSARGYAVYAESAAQLAAEKAAVPAPVALIDIA
jgi:hypothetical protein